MEADDSNRPVSNEDEQIYTTQVGDDGTNTNANPELAAGAQTPVNDEPFLQQNTALVGAGGVLVLAAVLYLVLKKRKSA